MLTIGRSFFRHSLTKLVKPENGGPINRDATPRQNTAKTPRFRIADDAKLIQYFEALP